MARYPTTYEGWLVYVQQHKLKRLGRGSSRQVYALSARRVLKLEKPVWPWRRGQCEAEVQVWLTASPERRRHLAPIYAYGRKWLVMARAQRFPRNSAEAWIYTRQLEERTLLEDMHPINIGMLGKRVVAIDYGFRKAGSPIPRFA